jgi:hypothetical protein
LWRADWYPTLFKEDGSETADSRFRNQFCKTLRMGINEPFVVLLLALLPNLRELDVYGMPHHRMALPWRNSSHFNELKRITAGVTGPNCSIGLLTSWAFGRNLKYLELQSARFVHPEEPNSYINDQINTPRWSTATDVLMYFSPNSTSITLLTLQYCTLSARHMGELLYAVAASTMITSKC